MFERVAAFDGDSTMIKTFPSAELFEVLTVLVFAADEALTVFVVLVVLVAVFFVFSFTVPVLADVFFDVGIVITPVKNFF